MPAQKGDANHDLAFQNTKNWLLCLAASSLIALRPAALVNNRQQDNPAAIDLRMPYGRHTDDLEEMVKRKNIRALVMINPIGFFYEGGQPMGVNYEALRDFETFAKEKLKTGTIKVEVTFIPVPPAELEAALTEGKGDVAAHALVITSERQERVAFTTPLEKDGRRKPKPSIRDNPGRRIEVPVQGSPTGSTRGIPSGSSIREIAGHLESSGLDIEPGGHTPFLTRNHCRVRDRTLMKGCAPCCGRAGDPRGTRVFFSYTLRRQPTLLRFPFVAPG